MESIDEAKWRILFRETSDAILWADAATGEIVECNLAAERLFKRTREELLGLFQPQLHPPGEVERYRRNFEAHAAGGFVAPLLGEIVDSFGRRVPVSIRTTRFETGGRCFLQGIFRDETEMHRAKEALRESEERYRRVVESLRAGYLFYRHDPGGRLTFVSSSIRDLLGFDLEELLGKTFRDFLRDDELAAADRSTEACLRGERPPRYELNFCNADGEARILEVEEGPVFGPGGEVVAIEGIIHDLTDRRRTEEELAESRRALETLLSNLPGMAYRCRNDRSWTMEVVSAGALGLTGWHPRDFISGQVRFGDLIHPDDRDMVWTEVQQALRLRQPYELVYRIRCAGEGEEKWVWERGAGVWDGSGVLRSLEGFITDISRRLRAEKALAESERRIRELVENVDDCVFALRVEGEPPRAVPSFLGPQVERMTGVPAFDFLSGARRFEELVHPDDRMARNRENRRLCEEAGRVVREYRVADASGDYRWVSEAVESRADASGRVRRIFGVARDITERKEIEEALRRNQQELATYHDLVTHDLSNLAMKLLGVLEFVLSGDAGPLSPEQEEFLRRANRQGLELERLAGNTRILSRISRAGATAEIPEEPLARIVARVVETARALHFDRPLEVTAEVGEGLVVRGVPFLENIVSNLVDNAIRYGPRDAKAPVRIVAEEIDGGRIALRVIGGTIEDPSILGRMFERYARGRRSTGSGLGLSLAQEIVERAGGAIAASIRSEGGREMCEIRLELPGGAGSTGK